MTDKYKVSFTGGRGDTLKLLDNVIKQFLSIIGILILIAACVFAFYHEEMGLSVVIGIAALLFILQFYLSFNSPLSARKINSSTSSKSDEQALAQCEQNLKDIQEQLIIQEKLASVGLLAAGIAHEIKNPLNFINNFSDMTIELLNELKKELVNPLKTCDNENKEAISSIIEDIVVNCNKINEHGKRAESIIKNMLVQARTSEVEKAPLDLNALLEEFLNLSYHGMRTQNNKLNVKIEKNLDKTLPLITVDQQSVGRVFLNLINNAIYATNEKAEKMKGSFMPTITIASEQDPQYIKIKIKDNGNGIPEEIRQKIFEPFFTTKPAGQGTGLGLPICHKIIVKEHDGKLDVNTEAGKFTEFVISLPKDKSTR